MPQLEESALQESGKGLEAFGTLGKRGGGEQDGKGMEGRREGRREGGRERRGEEREKREGGRKRMGERSRVEKRWREGGEGRRKRSGERKEGREEGCEDIPRLGENAPSCDQSHWEAVQCWDCHKYNIMLSQVGHCPSNIRCTPLPPAPPRTTPAGTAPITQWGQPPSPSGDSPHHPVGTAPITQWGQPLSPSGDSPHHPVDCSCTNLSPKPPHTA